MIIQPMSWRSQWEGQENKQKSFWEMSSYACPLPLDKLQGSKTPLTKKYFDYSFTGRFIF
jgi:hypothetical protein